MRTTMQASLAVLSGLAALATADALPPEDIPVQCATICGPMVELTSKCSPQQASKRDEAGELDGRALVIILPGPGLPKPETETETETKTVTTGEATLSDSVPQSTLTRSLPPLAAAPASSSAAAPAPIPIARPPPPPQAPAVISSQSSSSSSSSSRPTSSSSQPTSLSSSQESQPPSLQDGANGPESTTATQPVSSNKALANAERKCVCENTSFDVAMVAALCASCAGGMGDNLKMIMVKCSFPPLDYKPEKDRVVNNIRVVATRPTAVGSQNSVSSAARRTATMGGAVAAVCFVLGAAAMLG